MGPGVRAEGLQATSDALLKLQLQRVIVRGGGVGDKLDLPKRIVGGNHIAHLQQAAADRTNIRGGKGSIGTLRLLQGEIPLQCVRQRKLRVVSDSSRRSDRID